MELIFSKFWDLSLQEECSSSSTAYLVLDGCDSTASGVTWELCQNIDTYGTGMYGMILMYLPQNLPIALRLENWPSEH